MDWKFVDKGGEVRTWSGERGFGTIHHNLATGQYDVVMCVVWGGGKDKILNVSAQGLTRTTAEEWARAVDEGMENR